MSYEDDIPIEVARAAHAGTSFSPEDRAVTERQGYAATLRQDRENLAKYATTPEKQATLSVEFERYRAGYQKHVLGYLYARSRCMSTMITGGSNFPVRRQQGDSPMRRLLITLGICLALVTGCSGSHATDPPPTTGAYSGPATTRTCPAEPPGAECTSATRDIHAELDDAGGGFRHFDFFNCTIIARETSDAPGAWLGARGVCVDLNGGWTEITDGSITLDGGRLVVLLTGVHYSTLGNAESTVTIEAELEPTH